MTNLRSLDLSLNSLTGSIPSAIHKMRLLTRLSLDHNNVKGFCPPTVVDCSGIPQVTVEERSDTLSTLITWIPANADSPYSKSLSRRFLSTISTGTQTSLCDFIAATNIATISGYSAWNCTAAHAVVTQPCNGSTSVWAGVTACSTSGDVVAITLNALGISGESATNACGHHD